MTYITAWMCLMTFLPIILAPRYKQTLITYLTATLKSHSRNKKTSRILSWRGGEADTLQESAIFPGLPFQLERWRTPMLIILPTADLSTSISKGWQRPPSSQLSTPDTVPHAGVPIVSRTTNAVNLFWTGGLHYNCFLRKRTLIRESMDWLKLNSFIRAQRQVVENCKRGTNTSGSIKSGNLSANWWGTKFSRTLLPQSVSQHVTHFILDTFSAHTVWHGCMETPDYNNSPKSDPGTARTE
jgi:hypothetical protein